MMCAVCLAAPAGGFFLSAKSTSRALLRVHRDFCCSALQELYAHEQYYDDLPLSLSLLCRATQLARTCALSPHASIDSSPRCRLLGRTYRRKNQFCNAYGALQGAVSSKCCVDCVLNRAYGALPCAVSVARIILPTVLL